MLFPDKLLLLAANRKQIIVQVEMTKVDIQKIIELTPRIVNIATIDESKDPYCMSFGFDPGLLVQSIKKIGLINSPLLVEEEKGNFTIIAGYRRIKAIKSLGWTRIPCRVLPESGISSLECLLINLHDNLTTREFNEMEKAMVVNRLALHLPKTEILKNYMPLLNLPSNEAALQLLLRLENELDNVTRHHIARGRITVKAIKMLIDMDDEDREHVIRLIIYLKLNSNYQKQLIDYIVDLSRINNVSITELIKDRKIEAICSDMKMNNPQKAGALMNYLRGKRFPTLIMAEKSFEKKVLSLGLPKGIKITAPPYFEAPGYRLGITFREGKDLKEKIDLLSRLDGIEDLDDPWKKDL